MGILFAKRRRGLRVRWDFEGYVYGGILRVFSWKFVHVLALPFLEIGIFLMAPLIMPRFIYLLYFYFIIFNYFFII